MNGSLIARAGIKTEVLRIVSSLNLKLACWSGIFWLLCCSTLSAQEAFEKIYLMVPAERSGGWDLTAKAMVEALKVSGGAAEVEIEYSPGAGGLIGLAQFTSARRGQGNALLVGGMFTIGAVVQNRSAVSLLDTTPLARLTVDRAVLAVPAKSGIKSLDDLVEAMAAAPESVTWVGGSRAGVDELNLFEIATALGINPERLHYTGLPGGGTVGETLVQGKYDVGISGFSEFEELATAGQLRIIAVADNDDARDLSPVSSLEDLGIQIRHVNWRGVFAPPGISTEQRAALLDVLEKMVASPVWKEQLETYHWQDAYLAGASFAEFVRQEQEGIYSTLESMKAGQDVGANNINRILARRYVWVLVLAIISVLLIVIMFYQSRKAHNREEGLQHAFEEATGKVIQRTEELEKALAGIHAQIEQDFDAWNLTLAEREVALLLLKGLRLKEIADARGTSERTVRQQAQAVYKKAGLEGRSELAAFFIEDFMQSISSNADTSAQA